MGLHGQALGFRAALAVLLGTLTFSGVSAWLDQGHMLIATVAKLSLPPEIVAKIESILHKWDGDYPGVGTMETAAVWLDHVGCTFPGHFCSGFKAVDNIQVFRPWHFSTRVLNPQKLELSPLYQYYPIPKTGIEWVLYTTNNGLLGNPRRKPHDRQPPSTEGENSPPPHKDVGSDFSRNFHLRLLLHLAGDIHQPMHSASLYANGFPTGDAGGNAISVKVDGKNLTLHEVWDAAGLVWKDTFYETNMDDLHKLAREIMAEHPPESLKDRLSGTLRGDNFKAIAVESAALSLKEAYAEFDWSTFSEASLPYIPSDAYLKRVNQVARQQVAVGGYRLAYVLSNIAPHLPEPTTPNAATAMLVAPYDLVHRLQSTGDCPHREGALPGGRGERSFDQEAGHCGDIPDPLGLPAGNAERKWPWGISESWTLISSLFSSLSGLLSLCDFSGLVNAW